MILGCGTRWCLTKQERGDKLEYQSESHCGWIKKSYGSGVTQMNKHCAPDSKICLKNSGFSTPFVLKINSTDTTCAYKKFRFQLSPIFSPYTVNNNKGLNLTPNLTDPEKMENTTPGSLEEFQFTRSLKEEEDALKMSYVVLVGKAPLSGHGGYVSRGAAVERSAVTPARLSRALAPLLGQTEIGCCVFMVITGQVGLRDERACRKPRQNNNNKKKKVNPSAPLTVPKVLQDTGKQSRVLLLQRALCTHLVYNLKLTATRSYLGKPFTNITQDVFSLARQVFSHVSMLFNTLCYSLSPRSSGFGQTRMKFRSSDKQNRFEISEENPPQLDLGPQICL